jgi:HSP20 family molecular chaperone IbpA
MTRRTSSTTSGYDHIRRRMEQARQRVIGAPGSPFSVPFMEPAVDVYETRDAVIIVAEIAGIGQEGVELEVEGTTCILRGERKSGRTGPKRDYSQMEIGHGPFLRELLLPAAVNPDAAITVYKDGMLQISLPKASPAHIGRTKITFR